MEDVLSPFTLSAYRSFPGLAEQCRQARVWVRALVRDFSDVADAVEVVASEFFSNALRHTASGGPEGEVDVCLVGLTTGVIHLEVIDQGEATTTAERQPLDPLRPGGCGLILAEALSCTWGRTPADTDPRSGAHTPAPNGYTGPMITWAHFHTRTQRS
ncbi:ATP-binding protein [Allosalinactinospora lopnorensis]|uniref:ATP-binding protein n=1 Tax=Allosalinactinospora lopnorensis TaxID=1352348 RepID=UPI0009E4B065|nr:ATP-binding protein [Allosalinactinospora lopnorensis]